MLKIYYRILVSAWQTFGFSPVFFRWLLVMPVFALFTKVTLLLDDIFFRRYRNIEVRQPVFLVGHGRSGTTFLHRLLTQTGEFAVFELWHLLFPALTARILMKPVVNLLVKFDRATIYPKQIGHELTLNTIEEEEVLFLHKLDTQFVMLASPLGFDEQEHPEIRFHDSQAESRRKSTVQFFKSCLQRQILYTGKSQIIAKPNYSIQRIKTLIEVFPDAKFIYLVRSPHETIPSHLSLHHNIFSNQWNMKRVAPHKLKRYYQRRYRYNIDLYRYFYECQKQKQLPQDRVMILRYDELHTNLSRTFNRIVDFTGIQCSEALEQLIIQQSDEQKHYKRSHKVMNLEQFGLTSQQITDDLAFVFEEYGFDKNPERHSVPK